MFILSNLVEVVDVRGRTLTPCQRKVAEREVRLQRAKWIGNNRIRLRVDPFAYRYIRLKVLARDQHTCYWCGKPGETIDHIIPWSKGGRTTMTNCVTACQECNGQRGDMPAEEFARLKGVPVPQFTGNEPVPSTKAIRRPRPTRKGSVRVARRKPGPATPEPATGVAPQSQVAEAAEPALAATASPASAAAPTAPPAPAPATAPAAPPAPATAPVATATPTPAQDQTRAPVASPLPVTPERAARLMRLARILAGQASGRRHLL